MIEFELSVDINARRQRVWDELSDIARHVEWMDDAKAIRFTSSKTAGMGTTYECDTRVGFLSTTDRLMITQWIDGQVLTVSHEGSVKGSGKISLQPGATDGVVTVVWNEDLTFPWWLGGPVGEQIARAIFSRLWREDLRSLKAKCEVERDVNPIEFFKASGVKVVTRKRGQEFVVDLGESRDYATGSSAFGARYAALQRWQSERA